MSQCVLIVEDETRIRELLSRKMEQCGYRVSEAQDGKEAIRILGEEEVDLVISDIMMPEQDGLEVIMHLKKEHPEIQIIAISAPGNEVFLNSAKALGASRVFQKPFGLDEIARAVQELI